MRVLNVVMLLVVTLLWAPICSGQDTRQITVTVTCTDVSNAPIANLVIGVHGRGGYFVGTTDAQGLTSITATVKNDEPFVYVDCSLMCLIELPFDTADAVFTAQRELRATYWFGPPRQVTLDPQVANYSSSIVAEPGGVVRGRAVNGNGEPIRCRVAVPSRSVDIESSGTSGQFELKGLRVGHSSRLYVIAEDRIKSVDVTAGVQPVELGDVVFESLDRSATAQFVVSGFSSLPLLPAPMASGVMIVSADGQLVFVKMSPSSRQRPLQISVPPGTYYVAPGTFGGLDFQLRLIEKCAAGQVTPSMGVPSFTIGSGEITTVEIHFGEAREAIMQIP